MPEFSHYTLQLGSFFILVAVQSTAILLFKLCQQAGGGYAFSPASSVAMTEVCKLVLAASLHHQQVSSSGKPWFAGVNQRIVLHYFGLSLLYTVNNQLSFYVL